MTTIKEDYVSFEIAKLLKEKGFNPLECGVYYSITTGKRTTELLTSLIACPTLQRARKWLRESHAKFIEICIDRAPNFKDIVFRPAIYDEELDCLWESDNFITYEQACDEAIKYCLKNLI